MIFFSPSPFILFFFVMFRRGETYKLEGGMMCFLLIAYSWFCSENGIFNGTFFENSVSCHEWHIALLACG